MADTKRTSGYTSTYADLKLADRIHCLNANDTHLAPDKLQLHRQVVGDGPNGCPRRFVGIGWVPYTDSMLGLNAFAERIWPVYG